MKIQFETGSGTHFPGSVSYLISDPLVPGPRLYAECPVPDGASEDYGYLTLKAALLSAWTDAGNDPAALTFWYDGQEDMLDPDASAACETYTEFK